MSRADRFTLCLYRDDDGFALRLGSVTLSGFLGRHPRTARRHLRTILRSWGWPGRAVRDACAWPGVDRVAFISWPKRAPVLS